MRVLGLSGLPYAVAFKRQYVPGLGPAYDRMARVHRELPAMMLEYREMMRRFTREQARDLDAMRHALDKSRKLLEERAGTPPRAKD